MSADILKGTETLVEGGSLLVITGFSGSGKDELMRRVLSSNLGFERIVTHTSRPMRAGEVDGVDYHFVTKETFEEMLERKEFMEHVPYGDHYKGTHKDTISSIFAGKKLIWRIDMSRAAIVHETFIELFGNETGAAVIARTKVVMITPGEDLEVSRKRMVKRDGDKFDSIDFEKRMAGDLKVLENHTFKNTIHNKDGQLDESFKKLLEIIEGELV